MKKPNRYTTNILVRVSPEEKHQYEQLAAKLDTHLSKVVRNLLNSECQNILQKGESTNDNG